MSLGGKDRRCGRKKRHSTLEEAQAAINFTRTKNKLKAYRCPYCQGFHVGSSYARTTDATGDNTHWKTRRAECVSCKRLLAIKNKGMCVTCCRKAIAERGTALPLPPIQNIAPMGEDEREAIRKIWVRLYRYGMKVGRLWHVREGYVEDCGSEMIIGAIEAILNGAPTTYLPFLFIKGRDRLRRVMQSGHISGALRYVHPTKGPKSSTGRRYKGREMMFSELVHSDNNYTDAELAEMSGRIIA